MTAPERIRVAQDADGFWTCREAISGSQEYVRADIYEAALSVPAAAVVGEPGPIGYCSEYGLDKLASQAHHYCLSVSKAQENEFQFPIYASRISQQDAELERLRRELAETEELRAEGAAKNAALTLRLAEARKAAFIEAAEIAYAYECSLADYDGSVDAKHFYEGGVGDASIGISKALRAKAEGEDHG